MLIDVGGLGFEVAVDGPAGGPATLHCVDLATGRVRPAGRIGSGYAVTGLTVAPRGVGRP